MLKLGCFKVSNKNFYWLNPPLPSTKDEKFWLNMLWPIDGATYSLCLCPLPPSTRRRKVLVEYVMTYRWSSTCSLCLRLLINTYPRVAMRATSSSGSLSIRNFIKFKCARGAVSVNENVILFGTIFQRKIFLWNYVILGQFGGISSTFI